MRLVLITLATLSLISGCDRFKQQDSAVFEIRDFTTREETTAATDYSKEWNEFKSTGTLVAQNVPTDRAIVVTLEVKDISDSPNPEPQYAGVLVRRGTGKIEISKSHYGKVSKRPNYQWSVVGWQEMRNGTIKPVQ